MFWKWTANILRINGFTHNSEPVYQIFAKWFGNSVYKHLKTPLPKTFDVERYPVTLTYHVTKFAHKHFVHTKVVKWSYDSTGLTTDKT